MYEEIKPIWITVEDATRVSGIGRTLLYKMLNDGRLKGVHAGRKRLVSVKSIEELGSCQAPAAKRRESRRQSGAAAARLP
jgi:excisionase family DNA binding protein